MIALLLAGVALGSEVVVPPMDVYFQIPIAEKISLETRFEQAHTIGAGFRVPFHLRPAHEQMVVLGASVAQMEVVGGRVPTMGRLISTRIGWSGAWYRHLWSERPSLRGLVRASLATDVDMVRLPWVSVFIVPTPVGRLAAGVAATKGDVAVQLELFSELAMRMDYYEGYLNRSWGGYGWTYRPGGGMFGVSLTIAHRPAREDG